MSPRCLVLLSIERDFSVLLVKVAEIISRDTEETSLTPRAKTTVMALHPDPSVKPFSVVDEPRVPVLFVAAADMNGTESKRRLKEERILRT